MTRNRTRTPGGYFRAKEKLPPPVRYCWDCKHEVVYGWCRQLEKWVDLHNPTDCTYHKPKE